MCHVSFASCKKDSAKTANTVPLNTITATVGGTNINYATTQTAQLLVDSEGFHELQVLGLNQGLSSGQAIIFGVISINPIVKGTYTFNSSTIPNSIAVPLIKDESSTSADVFETDFTNDNSSTTSTVTITSISTTNVQGTFSGVLINENDSATTQTVTSGKFNVTITPSSAQSMNSRISAATMQSLKKRLKN